MRITIKQKLHDLIDKTENEFFLNQVYELINKNSGLKEGDLWNGLTLEQKQEVLTSLDESNDPDNLLPHEEVKKIYNKWL